MVTKFYYFSINELNKNCKQVDYLFSLLPSFRKQKALKYKNNIDKVRCIASFYLLLLALKENNISYKESDFLLDDNNKPYLKNNPIYFNISHSGSYVCVGISNSPIGVDIEYIDKNKNVSSLIDFVFNEKEKKEYEIVNDKNNFFYQTWVKKESFAKYNGKGLNIPFNKVIINKEIINLGSENITGYVYNFSIDNHICGICLRKKEEIIIKEVKL